MLIDDALKRLPPEQREVVYLKVFEGLTFQEIADRCGISINTAGSRYRYATDALRRALAPSDQSC
jgi:RNA polymerase sigma-70 factor, ECF subfamily